MEPESENGRPLSWPAIIAVAVGVMFLSAAGSFLVARMWRGKTVQPIAFNHRKHVRENKIECSVCHEFYETQTFSGLPAIDTCATCHTEAIGKSAEEQKVVKLVKDNGQVEWHSLFRQPPHIFYSHRRHVMKAKLKCERCHGDIADTVAPPVRVVKLRMNDCIACHEARGVATDCTTCHR
ncbi:MAG TPA: cytochrome c3 family protein [Thermoanaerobaculia bacterium]|nr:cytochrome c3 family protein [Thermoanaerobaculia bacterium]